MRRLLLITTLLTLVAGSGHAFNLDSLLIKSVGGPAALDKLRTVKTMYAHGIANLSGMPGTTEIWVAMPNRLCVELKLGPFTLKQVFDGTEAWQSDHNDQTSLLSGHEKRSLLSQVYFQTYSYLFSDRLPGGRQYLGVESHKGITCHKVAFIPLFTDTIYSYFDTATGRQFFDVSFVDNLEVETEYSDHQSVAGVLMAMNSHAIAEAAETDMAVTIDSVAFNQPLDSGLFVRPASAVDFRFPAGSDSVQVPFQMVAGHIYFTASVNGRPLRFLLDSGASANLFHRPSLEGLNLAVLGNLPAIGVAGYEKVDLIQTDSLTMGGLVLLAQVGGTMDLSQVVSRGSPDDLPFGGLLGYDFLSRFPILIDYRDSSLTVYNPDRFQPPVGGIEVPFELTLQVPTVKAELDGLPGLYLVDLGNAFGLIVHSEFSRTHDLLSKLSDIQELPHEIGGVGGGLSGKSAFAASFAFGDIRISDLRVLLPDSGSGLSGSVELAGNIGNLVLSQFRVLFDYRSQRLIFYAAEQPGK